MPGGRAYDYSAPFFGGFTCAPPAVNTTRADRNGGYITSRADSLRSNNRQSSFSRSDSVSSQTGNYTRADSLASRPQLTRMESLGHSKAAPGTVTTTSEYSIGPDGRPSHFSSTTYKSPYGNNYRTSSHY